MYIIIYIYIYIYNCKYIYISHYIMIHQKSYFAQFFKQLLSCFPDAHEVIEDHDRWISAAQDEEVAMDFIGIR